MSRSSHRRNKKRSSSTEARAIQTFRQLFIEDAQPSPEALKNLQEQLLDNPLMLLQLPRLPPKHRAIDDRLTEMLNILDLEDLQEFIEEHPQLLDPKTDTLLLMHIVLTTQEDQDPDFISYVQELRMILDLCREVGVEEAFERFIDKSYSPFRMALVEQLEAVTTPLELYKLAQKRPDLLALIQLIATSAIDDINIEDPFYENRRGPSAAERFSCAILIGALIVVVLAVLFGTAWIGHNAGWGWGIIFFVAVVAALWFGGGQVAQWSNNQQVLTLEEAKENDKEQQ